MSNKKLVIILVIGIIVVVILSLFFIFGGNKVSLSLGLDYSAGAGALDSMSKSGNVFEDLRLNPFGGE